MKKESDPPDASAVLVTGCAGFIGHNLCEALLRSGVEVVGFDECNAFYDPDIKQRRVKELLDAYPGFRFIDEIGKIRDKPLHTAFHLAAQANVRFCENNPGETLRCNQTLTKELLEELDPSIHFIFLSSSSVYGVALTPWGADTVPLPQGAYGVSKLECEALVRTRGPPATIIRPFSIVGAGIRPDLALSIFMDRIIHRDTVEIFGDGSARRDFTHVDDLVDTLLNAMRTRRLSTNVAIYPVGSGSPRTVNELVQVISKETKREAQIVHSPPHPQELPITFADSSKVINELGFQPRRSLETAVRDMLRCPRKIEVVVVVASCGREKLLRDRSLPSIQKQTVAPARVCVVLDEAESASTDLQALRQDFPKFEFIRNCRTKGASGAWNTGVMQVATLPEVQMYCYLAILDDDDSWERNHLETCLKETENGLADLVVSGIVRHEGGENRKQTIPETLRQEDFFVGNPHIQGSNLFLSLRLFFRAGGFDEFLPSCTDRDLCIRLFDVSKDLNIRTTESHTVHHYADSSVLRLSSPRSSNKRLGVLRFAHKHSRRMTGDERTRYWARAKTLFAVEPNPLGIEVKNVATRTVEQQIAPPAARVSLLWNEEVTSLLFGVISDKPEVVSGLISDISRIPNARILLLANGMQAEPFQHLIQEHKVAGSVIQHCGERLSISEARTLVQVHCGQIWKNMMAIDAVVIMDDDKRLPHEWFSNLCSLLRREPPDGGFLGPDIGAPPLPAAFLARTSMIDLFYSKFKECDACPYGLEGEDLFYDLSDTRTDHLEYPVRSDNSLEKPRESILKGIPIYREAMPNLCPVASVERGGCCVVLNPTLLVTLPNPRVSIGAFVTRRSDMLWVKQAEQSFIKHPALAVHHDRTRDKVQDLSSFLDTAHRDLLGAAMCRPKHLRKSFMERRLKQLGANILRIQGLETALGMSPLPHFCYQTWVDFVIRPIASELMDELDDKSILFPSPNEILSKTVKFTTQFRVTTAKQLLLREYPDLRNLEVIGSGSEGVVLRSSCTPELKYKILDGYRPRATTFVGSIPGHSRQAGSTILVSPYIFGEPYTGGNGPAIVQRLRKIQDTRLVCFRNWKPANLVVNNEGVHFVDFGRDVVAFSPKEFAAMVDRAYLSWRFPNHGDELKQYCRNALTERIPQLDMVDLMIDAINDRQPDKDLFDLIDSKLKQIASPESRILDFGAGRAKFHEHSGIDTVNYDPKVRYPGVINNITQVPGTFDVVLCIRVLCILTPDEFLEVLKQVRRMLNHISGHAIFTICDPRGINCENPEKTFSFEKTVSTGRTRPEWYRPLRVVRLEMARIGLEIVEEFEFLRVDQDRFEWKPDQWCCVAKACSPPRHTLLIKTCLMEHATIKPRVQHLIETLPFGTKTLLVLDCKKEGFLRGYAEANETQFREEIEQLLLERWIDQLLEPPSQQAISDMHEDWFGFTPDFSKCEWSHDELGVQYASTFHGFSSCGTEFVLQVDSDIMVFRGKETPKLPLSLFEQDPLAVTWSLPIANHKAKPLTTGHRFEIRACLVHIPRLKELFRLSQTEVRELIRSTHWYRIVDKVSGQFKSYRGGQRLPYFVHPQNDIKRDEDEYLLAIDAVQSGRLHPEQYGKVDWVGWPDGRGEPVVILVCGRNVPAGRMLRCIDSIKRNVLQDKDIGLVVIDDSSSRQTAIFLKGILPRNNTTFVSRRKWAGYQANMHLGCKTLCCNPKTVICTVDLDDALLGKPIQIIKDMYTDDPDLEAAFGGCVRVDKPGRYDIDETRPNPPRDARGQPYWAHIRTFRKILFDRIRETDLGLGSRSFVVRKESPLAADWAFSLPIWEQARNVTSLKGDLYLFEPGTTPNMNELNAQISQVVALPPYSRRTYNVAVVGDSNIHWREAYEVGLHLAEAGYIVSTGGLGGVMEEACRGAKKGRGITVGILPGNDPNVANPFVDIAIATGMGRHRNGIVALASAVVIVGGGAGTRSESSMAWAAKRLIISLKNVPGCSKDLADMAIDSRQRYADIPGDRVYGVEEAKDIVPLLKSLLPLYNRLSSRL